MKYRDMNGTATQTERADDRQVQNSTGGYVYAVKDTDRLRRFLVLGTEGGTFYASQRDLTQENTQFLTEYASKSPSEFLSVLIDVNANNSAPRHSTVLYALATLWRLASDTTQVKAEIKARFSEFVRTGTHLFEFTDYVTAYTKGSRGLRSMLAKWYTDKSVDELAYQVLKYRQRGGWSHKDILSLAHPKAEGDLNRVLNYVVKGTTPENREASLVLGQFESVKAGELDPKDATLLSWEMLPTEALKNADTWRALLKGDRLPYTAMMRNLGRMTAIGVFDDPKLISYVAAALGTRERVQRARVHPFNVLTALKTYGQGGGFRGSLTWTPKQPIVDSLDEAFRLSFGNVESTGKRMCIALDVSGSMAVNLMNSNVTAREGSVAMALATLAADPDTTDTIAFTSAMGGWRAPNVRGRWGLGSEICEVGLSTRRRLDDVIRETRQLRMGGTDCALPMLWAQARGKVYDAFVVYTDSETYAGSVQPMDALREYRRKVNPEARLIVVGMTSTGFSIADPEDAGSLDVTGFDTSAPRVISDFIAGKF